MKQSKKIVERRRNDILEMIHRTGDIKVEDICKQLNVSPLTIRRDLKFLKEASMIERYHGGVRINHRSDMLSDIQLYQHSIAKYAASLIEDHDTIFINSSATALSMLPYITAKAITVITNNGNAIHTKRASDVTIILTGGELRHRKGCMVGEFALNNINKVSVNKTFIGCGGLSSNKGMTITNLNEVRINEMMFLNSIDTSYILADHQKIGKTCNFVSCGLNIITNIITDERADSTEVEKLRGVGIDVVQVTM